jgi:hypothetical protein
MITKIEILSKDVLGLVDLYDSLKSEVSLSKEVLALNAIRRPPRLGGLDPGAVAVLTAVVSAVSSGVATLITAIFRVLERHQIRDAKIVIVGKGGQRLEFPVGIDQEKRKALMAMLNEIEDHKLILEKS